jgi:hypothetical protein
MEEKDKALPIAAPQGVIDGSSVGQKDGPP